MKSYTKVYCDFFGYGEQDFIPSEVSGNRAVDTHHITKRNKYNINKIENLVALTRDEHTKAEADKEYNQEVQIIHLKFIQLHRPDYEIREDYLKMLKP